LLAGRYDVGAIPQGAPEAKPESTGISHLLPSAGLKACQKKREMML
jgi:hypothetical protein